MTVKGEILPPRPELSSAQRALLEQRLQRARPNAAKAADARPAIPRRTGTEPVPLSFAQERLWFLDQLEPGTAVYNLSQATRIRGPLNVAALEQALNGIVQRHEALRTNFVVGETGPVQVVAADRTLRLTVTDVSTAAGAVEANVRAALEQEVRRPFNLMEDVLIRALLVRTSAEDHTLLLTMHHIVSDGWSLGVLFRELAAAYTACATGQPAQLAPLPVQYGDYVVWERARMQGAALDKAMAYWRQQLAGPLPVLELPTDHPRASAGKARGADFAVSLPRSVAERLKAIGRAEGASLFMTLLAAFDVLLHRWTGQEDIIVGSVVAGRNKVELEPLIGFFVNTLVLRNDLSGSPTFRELLTRVRETTFAALTHQETPFDHLVKELRPDRTRSRNPLFQVMFALQNAEMAPAPMPQLTLEPVAISTATAKFDLTLLMLERADGLHAEIEYNAELFERATIVRLVGCFQTLLEGIAANPELPIAQLPLLTAAQRDEVLYQWNRTTTEYPRDQTVTGVFEGHVARAPDAVALSFDGGTMTYAELNRRANQLGHWLRAAGVGPGVIVALCLERSPEMIIALLGILKAGGAYLSLDPSYPAERLVFMLGDSEAPVVLTVAGLQARVPAPAATGPAPRVLLLDTSPGELAALPDTNLAANAGPLDAAYVSYTSGSTGRPKGVRVPHRGVNRLVINTNYMQLRPDDAVAQIANCAFDASTWEIWGALLNGARLVIVPAATVLSPADFETTLATNRVTALLATTALFNQLVRAKPAMFRSLRYVLFGGEAAHPGAVRSVLRAGPPQHLLNAYGPTESTTIATCLEVKEVAENATAIPIGPPIANTTVYVLDAQRQPVPVGVPGELYVGGDGVACGYLRRPELDAIHFLPDPFRPEAGARMYRTGDRAAWRTDGSIEFLGRVDRQVKIRGFRIEPGEIETALERHPAIKQAMVVVFDRKSGDRQLAAYLVRAGTATPSPAELRQHLQAGLPDAMMPAAFCFLDTVPLTANGKVDRDALPPVESAEAAPERCAPRDDIERQLVEIWATVLENPNVGVRDGFFDLGGHSLLAVQVVAQIEKRFARKLPVSAIFEHSTIEELAKLLRPGGGEYRSSTSLVAIQPQGHRPPLYFVHGVGGGMFWGYSNIAKQLGPDQPIYAFKSRGLDGVSEWATIEEMATNYVADLRAQQPQGPYLIGGYCFGGVVAYEMARVLEAQGQQVALLALISCSAPNSSYELVPKPPTVGWTLQFLRNLGFWGTRFVFRWSLHERVEFVRWKFRLISKRLFGRAVDASKPENTDVDQMVNIDAYTENQRQLWQSHVSALRNYTPGPYGGRATLFRTHGHPLLCSFDDQFGWQPLITGGLKLRVVAGGHGNILTEPHVATIARELSAELESAQAPVAKPALTLPPPASTPR